jgi:multiple sugar transport system permease protein
MVIKKMFFHVLRLIILAVIILWSGFPILMVFLSAFKDPKTIFDYPPKFFFKPTLNNFFDLSNKWPEYYRTLLNSLVVTLGSVILTVVLCFLAGYAYSRFRSRALTMSAFFMLIVRMLPPIVMTIPMYPVLNALGLFDKHITLIVLYGVFYFSLGTFLMKSFIDQLPIELDESAFMDGATRFQVLRKIIFPLSAHGLMATATFVMIFSWKEYMYALLFTTTNAKTAPLIISEMLGAVVGVSWGPVFAAAAIQLVPILVYILFVQGVLVEGMMVGSIKG